jgi:hypothetical protein
MGDLRDYNRMTAASPELQAMRSIGTQAGQSSPLLALLQGDASALLGQRSDIGGALEGQALEELRAGRGLTEQEQRDADQSARAAWASRGLAHSNPAVGAEILNRDSVANARLAQRRGFAGGVMGLLQGEDDQRQRYAMGVEELGMRDLTTRAQVAGQASAPLLNILAQRGGHNFNNVLGSFNAALPIGAASGILSQAPSMYSGASAIAPLYSYGADVANTNFNAAASQRAAQANMWANLSGAALGAGGQVAGAGMRGGGGGGSAASSK